MHNPNNNFCIFPMSWDQFTEWYKELGKLKIFWAKPVNDIKLVSVDNEKWLIEIEWIIRRQIKSAIMCIASKASDEIIKLIRKGRYANATKLIITPEDSVTSSSVNANAASILYFWDVCSKTLEPRNKLKIDVLFNWDDSEIEIFRQIHKMSWGFFMPPRKGDHIVVLAYLQDTSVGMAYLNKHNFNIDYGIHVVRNLWRNRIGTKLLSEVLKLAKDLGVKYVSVVRILRSLSLSSSDRRAISFYKANNPSLRLIIQRVANESPHHYTTRVGEWVRGCL